MKLQYGIISTASITPRFIQAVQNYGDEVVAIASRSLEKAQAMSETYHIKQAYGSYQELYEDEAVDVVYIASANHTHYAEAKTALMHHKHVVLEKPFVLTSEEALSLFQYAAKQDCFLMEAQKSVFLPATNRLKEIIETKTLGKLVQIDLQSSFPNQYPQDHWMYKPYGGALYGSGSYTIEYLMHLLEDPQMDAQALGIKHKQGGLIDVNMQLLLNEDILVNSSISMRVKNTNMATFFFDHGKVEVDAYWRARGLRIIKEDGSIVEENFPIEFEMVYEVEHIHHCIEESSIHSSIMTPERTIICTQIIEELMQCLQEK